MIQKKKLKKEIKMHLYQMLALYRHEPNGYEKETQIVEKTAQYILDVAVECLCRDNGN